MALKEWERPEKYPLPLYSMAEMKPLPIMCEDSESSMYGEPYLWR
jgi:hypothetical protein